MTYTPTNSARRSQLRTLAALRAHMRTMIYERDDMAIREALLWVHLLSSKPNLSVPLAKARGRGFAWINVADDVDAARAILSRFVRVFG